MKTLCVGVILPQSDLLSEEESLGELVELGQTAGYDICDSLTVSSSQVFAPTYMSKPMATDLLMEIDEYEAEVVLFNEDLSPAQLRNLEKIWQVMVIDRTELILKIFQIHARTQEAKIQVEIAQLKYTLPRLKRMWTHLSRIEGGFGFSKGPGETQIELDRRMINKRLSKLSKKLKLIGTRRDTRRKKRLDSRLPMLSLVGYTNAGKTSLLNALAKEKLLAEDQLFATLSPVTRKVFLKHGHFALMADTVGFIKKLPTHLVASFRSTLQEIEYSDVLVVVQDITHMNYEEQLQTVHSILGEMEALDTPQILVFSKSDLLSEEDKHKLRQFHPEAVLVSAHNGDGLDDLKERILHVSEKLSKETQQF